MNFVNESVNRPCSSSLSPSIINGMTCEEETEIRRTSPFAEPNEGVEEGPLEIDEGVVEGIMSLDPPFVLKFDAVETKGVECVRRTLEQLGNEAISGTEPVFDEDDDGEDTFVDVVGVRQRDEGAESEGFTFADALIRVNLLSETVLEGDVSSSDLPLC